MPRTKKTHEQNRQLVCLLCLQKGTSMIPISGEILMGKIRKNFLPSYNPSDSKFLRQHRGYQPDTDHFSKLGIDLKVCLNLQRKDDDLSKQATKWSYSKGACSSQFKDSGVNKLIILGMVEDVCESYDNLKTMINLTGLQNFNFANAFDMKLANTFLGLSTAASSHPCPWCEQGKKDFANKDTFLTGGKLRTLSSIRENSLKYQTAAEKHKGKQKLSSAAFFNCEQKPLCDLDGTTLVLDVLPPMELHLLLGVVNGLYDHLNDKLLEKNCSISAKNWSEPLGLKRSEHHGGQFNGNDCVTLLTHTQSLEKLLGSVKATFARPIVNVLQAFNEVKNACFGNTLKANYKLAIKNFAYAYMLLGIRVTPKVHSIFVHVPQFLEKHQSSGKGLGYWSEQASEAVHKDFENIWSGSSYKRAMSHKDYPQQLLKCVVTYNSRHQ